MCGNVDVDCVKFLWIKYTVIYSKLKTKPNQQITTITSKITNDLFATWKDQITLHTMTIYKSNAQ